MPPAQWDAHSYVMNTALNGTSELPLEAEWERVALVLCRGIWDRWATRAGLISALSTSVHVNGDGRSAAERGVMPYEPGAHGATCTIGPDNFAPIAIENRLPNYGQQ